MPPSSVAQIQLTVGTSGLATGIATAGRMLSGFASATAGATASVARSIASVGMRAAGHFVGTMATRGLDFMVEQGHNVLKFEEALVRLGLASRKSGAELREIGDSARSLSTSTGLDALEVLRGARAYIDLAGAEAYTAEKMSLIARAAQASDADIGDVATVVYSLTNALQIAGPELENTIGGLLNQSKSGAIHFTQMAQEMVALAPSFAQFGIKGREGAIRLGAALQIVRTGFGSASEAGTGMQRLMRSLPQHAKLFEKGGVQIFKKGSRSELLTLDQIMENIYKSKLRMDRPALIKAFGRGEAERAFQLFQGSGLDEQGKIVDNITKYHELIEAGRVNGTVQADLATYTQSSSGKIAAAVEKMKNAVAVAFTPERVAGFADALTRAAGAFMDAANWIDSHVQPSNEVTRNRMVDIGVEGVHNMKGWDSELELAHQGKAAVAKLLQNYKFGNNEGLGFMGSTISEIMVQSSLATGKTDPKYVEAVVHEVGRKIGHELHDPRAISAQALVEEDEERAAGQSFLKKLGFTDAKTAEEEAGRSAAVGSWNSLPPAEQQKAIAGAVRDALTPTLDRIARALGERSTSINIDGNPVARSVENAQSRRSRP